LDVDAMLEGSAIRRNPNYLVPCVFKAVQMIEALREARAGMRVEDFRVRTGYSRSTIYRILRTLSACKYAIRDRGGFYRLNYEVVAPANGSTRTGSDAGHFRRPMQQDERQPGFERWGVRFCANGGRTQNHQALSTAVD